MARRNTGTITALLRAAVAGLLLILATAPAGAVENRGGVLELEWDDLIPAEFTIDQLVKDLGIDELEDDDPRVPEMLAQLQGMLSVAPTVNDLDGVRVRLPGFVLPLEMDAKKVSEFLLVPYFGACIHVPPPPSNQVVYVKTGPEGAAVREMYDTVWVTGRLRVERFGNDVGDAGYTLYAERVEPYQE